jgi:hypothetical protein
MIFHSSDLFTEFGFPNWTLLGPFFNMNRPKKTKKRTGFQSLRWMRRNAFLFSSWHHDVRAFLTL